MKGLPAGAVQSEDPFNAIHGTSFLDIPHPLKAKSILVARMKEALPHRKEKVPGCGNSGKLSETLSRSDRAVPAFLLKGNHQCNERRPPSRPWLRRNCCIRSRQHLAMVFVFDPKLAG
jgi:hypothetical protein